jgi:hypothetical protein
LTSLSHFCILDKIFANHPNSFKEYIHPQVTGAAPIFSPPCGLLMRYYAQQIGFLYLLRNKNFGKFLFKGEASETRVTQRPVRVDDSHQNIKKEK